MTTMNVAWYTIGSRAQMMRPAVLISCVVSVSSGVGTEAVVVQYDLRDFTASSVFSGVLLSGGIEHLRKG